MVSRTFPAYHPRKGDKTFFVQMIKSAFGKEPYSFIHDHKIHTIRDNYKLWEKRIKAIQEGKAVLSLRYWSASPYNYKQDGSKQIEFQRLDKDSGIGIQEIRFLAPIGDFATRNPGEQSFTDSTEKLAFLAANDGLKETDFKDWFRKFTIDKSYAIIHFTSFRY